MKFTLPFLTLLLLFGAFTRQAGAQISVSMEAQKEIYVAYEPLNVNLNITNRAGRDIVLSGRGGNPWLTFQISDSQGNLISPSRPVNFEPVIVPSGQALERTIPLNSFYPMTRKGLYRIRASVYFPQLDNYFNSQVETVHVADGRPFWSQVVGVPDGEPGAGTYRRYTLMTFTNAADKQLYLRVADESSGSVYTTYSLGNVIMVRDPQATIDSENHLHVLHMGAPRTYAHTVIGVDGRIIEREVFREEGTSRPSLVAVGDGSIVVRGGISEKDENANPLEGQGIHKLSERPKGLPVLE